MTCSTSTLSKPENGPRENEIEEVENEYTAHSPADNDIQRPAAPAWVIRPYFSSHSEDFMNHAPRYSVAECHSNHHRAQRRTNQTISVVLFCLATVSPLSALGSGETNPHRSLDTPLIQAELRKAMELAGKDESLLVTQRQQTRTIPDAPVVHLEPGSEQHAKPTKLFDNLYYVGGTEVGSFILTSEEGDIMIDAGYSYMPEDYILPGMKELGLDPARIKYILVTHAGPDHVGGAQYFQSHYGTRIVMSQEEWGGVPKDGSKYFGSTPPTPDIVGTDGQTITLGDLTVTIVTTPRTVRGGGLSYIAKVYDNGTPHVFATYGNTNVVGSLGDKKVYRASIEKFLGYVDRMHVDVVISNHPFVDGSLKVMDQLRARKAGEPHPFVYGQDRVRRFFQVLDQSAVVLTLLQEAGLDETGTKLATSAGDPASQTSSWTATEKP